MAKYILANAGDINWMALFALLTFFFLFVVSAIAILWRSKGYIHKMAHLPLEDNLLTSEIQNNEK